MKHQQNLYYRIFQRIRWYIFFQNYSLKHDPENNFVGGIVDNSIDSWFLDKSGGGGFDEGTHETKFLIVGFFEEILNIDIFYVD